MCDISDYVNTDDDPSTKFSDAFTARPCTRCGDKRNWSIDGQLQAVCYDCGHPKIDHHEPSEAMVDAAIESIRWPPKTVTSAKGDAVFRDNVRRMITAALSARRPASA